MSRYGRKEVLEGIHEGIRSLYEGDQHEGSSWYVVPADDKKDAQIIVSQVILDTLRKLKMSFPKLDEGRARATQGDPQNAGEVDAEG